MGRYSLSVEEAFFGNPKWMTDLLADRHRPSIPPPCDRAVPASLTKKVETALGAAMLLLLAASWAMQRGATQSRESVRLVTDSHEVRQALQRVLSAAQDVETGARGFALSGAEAFLEPYRIGRLRVGKEIDSLARLVADDAPQSDRLGSLRELATRRVHLADSLVHIRRREGVAVTEMFSAVAPGQLVMDQLRAAIGELDGHEQRLLSARDDAAESYRKRLFATIVLGNLLAFGLLGAFAWRIRDDILARLVAESKLAESEQRFRVLLDGVRDYAILMLDPRGIVSSWNEGAERITGYAESVILDQHVSHLYLPEDVERGEPERELARAAAESRHETEGWRCRKDGSRYRANIVTTAVRFDNGELRGFAVAIRDVTERVELEERFNGLLEAAPDAMVIADHEGGIRLVNRETERLFGYSRADLVGKRIDTLMPGRIPKHHPDHRAVRPIGAALELMAQCADGTEFPVEVSLSSIETSEGTMTTTAIRDVTKRRAAEAAVAEQKALLESILANIGDGVVAVDVNGAFRLYNPAAERIIGLGATSTDPSDWAATYGTYLSDTRTPMPIEDMPLMRALRGESPDGLEMFIRAPGASTDAGTWISCTARPLRDTHGVITGAVVAIQDVTARKHADEERRSHAEELGRSNAELQQFAYVASHDLQEPLRMVASYTQLLSKRYTGRLDAQADEFIAFAVDGATRMQRLISDLLVYSRAGSRGKVLREVSSGDALADAVTNLHAAILESGATVVHTTLPCVLADKTQLTQLFQNLLANAIKFCGTAPPRLEISAVRDADGAWTFAVRDNGIGIEPQYFQRIFAMFQRLHASGDYPGSGIGLAICKRIVERHGGRIWLESAPGAGSTFFFTVPAP